MSKPSDDRLERDGVEQWLGKNRKELSNRIGRNDEMIHEGMLADFVQGKIELLKGRPRKEKVKTEPHPLDSKAAEYDRRRAAQKDGLEPKMTATDLIVELAGDSTSRFSSLRDHIYRAGRKRKSANK